MASSETSLRQAEVSKYARVINCGGQVRVLGPEGFVAAERSCPERPIRVAGIRACGVWYPTDPAAEKSAAIAGEGFRRCSKPEAGGLGGPQLKQGSTQERRP